MIPYKNLGGNSGVVAYLYDVNSITVRFKSLAFTAYTYTNASAGKMAIDAMKKLADKGQGLNSYISKNKPPFVSKKKSLLHPTIHHGHKPAEGR